MKWLRGIRSRKRTLLVLLLLLAGGAIINVAVALSCARWSHAFIEPEIRETELSSAVDSPPAPLQPLLQREWRSIGVLRTSLIQADYTVLVHYSFHDKGLPRLQTKWTHKSGLPAF